MDAMTPSISPEILEERVLKAIGAVTVGEGGPDVLSAGLVHEVVATSGAVRVLMNTDRVGGEDAESLAEVLTDLVRAVPGVIRVVVKPRPQRLAEGGLPGVDRVIGVHSGKGGVGKSTLTANLAVALAERGLRVGLLDADVYGPSAPTLLGMSGRAETTDDGKRIAPREAFGIKVMSLGFLLPAEKALIWRGSLVDEGLPQLMTEVDWGPLDLLLVDLPPGTSDVHLAVARHAGLSGVIAVTQPGQTSVQDVRRGLEMFADIAVPCLGIVENMVGLVCRRCGAAHALFGTGGGRTLAEETGLPLLARIPFLPDVVGVSDTGNPAILALPDSPMAEAVRTLAEFLAGSAKSSREIRA